MSFLKYTFQKIVSSTLFLRFKKRDLKIYISILENHLTVIKEKCMRVMMQMPRISVNLIIL